MKDIKLNKIKDAIEAIRNGEIIIVVDDEKRENEGDFIAAAEMINSSMINFMAKHGRGLICLAQISYLLSGLVDWLSIFNAVYLTYSRRI